MLLRQWLTYLNKTRPTRSKIGITHFRRVKQNQKFVYV